MSATTSIQWTDKTWNPVRGCSVISPGCVNCYAMKQAHRLSGPGKAYEGLTKLTARSGPQWTGKVVTVESALLEPLSWRKPSRVFVNSMSDLFHDDVPFEFIDRVFAVMALASCHTFQILTKRPTRMYQYMTNRALSADYWKRACPLGYSLEWRGLSLVPFPLPNVWLGVSVENQDALQRVDRLKDIPAAVRFVSFEPLLEHLGAVLLDGINWAIVGGESGSGARPFDIGWARSIVTQCKAAGVPVFVKQLGAVPTGDVDRVDVDDDSMFGPQVTRYTEPITLRDRKGGNPDEWPDDLRVREFPKAAA